VQLNGGAFLMPKKGQKFQRYDRDLVLSIVQEKLQGDSSYTQLSKKYNIPEGTISVWVHKYTTKAWDCSDRRGKKDDCDIDYKVRYEIVKKFLIFLQQKH
ncbi:MAG: transposase, partial [Clostridiales bacterium]|nr:transposase [Clostridiales bacterium]